MVSFKLWLYITLHTSTIGPIQCSPMTKLLPYHGQEVVKGNSNQPHKDWGNLTEWLKTPRPTLSDEGQFLLTHPRSNPGKSGYEPGHTEFDTPPMEFVPQHSNPQARKSTPGHILANEGHSPENSQQDYPGFSQPLLANEGKLKILFDTIHRQFAWIANNKHS
ncbi:hypothetical protein PGT21_015831 [Puccinia graminis f. sp. tritici]|uniref:Uncharacterized protein n=1 Tax=Puccinia graminis f. sp. tritici TaxID=56615 RepID=A0A5B0PRU2_PUCGR|nr:hypothetical protein PGT21_015831 [Puccinia graminis f. sp. tritici]